MKKRSVFTTESTGNTETFLLSKQEIVLRRYKWTQRLFDSVFSVSSVVSAFQGASCRK
jgi:hypothetical protein